MRNDALFVAAETVPSATPEYSFVQLAFSAPCFTRKLPESVSTPIRSPDTVPWDTFEYSVVHGAFNAPSFTRKVPELVSTPVRDMDDPPPEELDGLPASYFSKCMILLNPRPVSVPERVP